MIALTRNGWYEEFSQFIPNLRIASDGWGNINFSLLKKADIVLFPGGADVNPAIYGEEKLIYTVSDARADQIDLAILNEAVKNGQKILGICRGHQFICAAYHKMKLIQDLPTEKLGHGGGHPIFPVRDSIINNIFLDDIVSTHHQGVRYSTLPQEKKELVTSIYHDVVEATETKNVITLQFHPEFSLAEQSVKFFDYIQNGW
jgi:gamma-glutamyl-gamma-aminobutyrate hydrolase PuuD